MTDFLPEDEEKLKGAGHPLVMGDSSRLGFERTTSTTSKTVRSAGKINGAARQQIAGGGITGHIAVMLGAGDTESSPD
ncbi:MAG: hypothetical protein M3Z75_03425 [Actinomycetota bacterium]|nr:hypothetical protein [Actinomycetota bacterium]